MLLLSSDLPGFVQDQAEVIERIGVWQQNAKQALPVHAAANHTSQWKYGGLYLQLGAIPESLLRMKFILREVTSGNQEKKRGGGENHKEKHENEKKNDRFYDRTCQ